MSNVLCPPSLETEVVEANDLDDETNNNNQTNHAEADKDLDQSTFSIEDDSLPQNGSNSSLKVFFNLENVLLFLNFLLCF